MGWLEQSRIFLENAFISDEDETDAEQAYLNYLADWIFNHQGNELCENEPVVFSEWKQQNRFVQEIRSIAVTDYIIYFLR